MHRECSILGGLALGLVLLASAGMAAEYSGAISPGLASVDASKGSVCGGTVRMAEAGAPSASSNDDAAAAEARKRLKAEIDRMRRSQESKSDSKSGSSQPAKKNKEAKSEKEGKSEKEAKFKKEAKPENKKEAKPEKEKKSEKEAKSESGEAPRLPDSAGSALDPEINRAAGKLIIMHFTGSQPSDGGAKAVRALMQDGLIAGVMFKAENIQSRSQLKELMKFLLPSGKGQRPVFAISEFGGSGGGFPRIKDFETWPSEKEVASKGDPEYAYLTYRSLGSFLAALGFNMNFGPAIGPAATAHDAAASFSESPLQAGVFAKTFILGHRDDNIVTVPVVDGSDLAVRAMKTLLVSYPLMPIAVGLSSGADALVPYDGLVRGPRFCFVTVSKGSDSADAASNFNRGCDVLVIDGGKDSPAAIRDLVGQGVSDAVKRGSLTKAVLDASAQRLSALRFPPPPPDGFTTRTSQ